MPEYKTNVSYRTIGSNQTAGNLSCGFLYKPDDRGSNRDITFEYYGGLILLDGEGEYFDRSHTCVKLSRGSFVQRLPGVKHSTIVKPDGKWLEFFICVSAESYHNLLTMGLLSDRPVMRCEENALEEILPAARSLLYHKLPINLRQHIGIFVSSVILKSQIWIQLQLHPDFLLSSMTIQSQRN